MEGFSVLIINEKTSSTYDEMPSRDHGNREKEAETAESEYAYSDRAEYS